MPAPTVNWTKIYQPNAVYSRFPSRRSVVYGTKGMVASSQPLATAVGLEILNKGGNAADAAVAVSAALNVTEPGSCGIGGDAFCLFYDATAKRVKALNGSGRAPRQLTIDHVKQRGCLDSIPPTDINSVTVPGAAAAWLDSIQHFGSKKVTVGDVFAPAIRLAEGGYAVSELSSRAWQSAEASLESASAHGDELLVNGKAPLPGQFVQLPTLAETFKELVKQGKDGFYKGRVAEAIVDLVQSKGGLMDLEDLANHATDLVEPIQYTYAGVTVHECPPNGQGLTALIALGILENMQEQGISPPLEQLEHNSPEYLHVLIEALRLAFADSRWYVTDPKFKHVPVEQLLSKPYLAERAKLFDPKKSNMEIEHGSPVNSSDTVYLSVTDQWGNACSFIQSTYGSFGSAAVPKGCGFTLQNRGSNFFLDPNHPNCLEGGKRPYHTIIPALATRGDELFLSYGVMGSFMQPQGHVQVLLNILRGFTVQEALDSPRFCISPEVQGANEVYFEEGIAESTIKALREMGHDARVLKGFAQEKMGRGQVIQKVQNEAGRLIWAAGSDPRADGHAVAQI